MTSKDLTLKLGPIEIKQANYSPFAQIFTKMVKKDDKSNKVAKYDDDLMYNYVYNFNEYSVSNFHEISPLDFKFDTQNKFYKDFKKLDGVKSQISETKEKKITVLKNASMLYDELIKIYKLFFSIIKRIIRLLKAKIKTRG